MALMDWTKEFDVKNDGMNSQHQQLIQLMNNLHDQHQSGADFDDQWRTLGQLAELTARHFRDEEEHMESMGYADLIAHSAIHQRLLNKLTEQAQVIEQAGEVHEEVFEFLKDWLTGHMLRVDQDYAACASRRQ